MPGSRCTSVFGGGRRLLFLAASLLFLMALSGSLNVQAQVYYGSLNAVARHHELNPHHPTPYYLPYYDDRTPDDWWIYWSFFRDRRYRGRQWYWYPWTWRWSRYDVPDEHWWAFGEGFVDEYGSGVVRTAGDPRLAAWAAESRAKPLRRVDPALIRAAAAEPRMTGQTRMRSVGFSGRGGGSSIGFAGGGRGGSSRGGKRK